MAGVEKRVQVRIKALVEGVREVLTLVDAVQKLSAAGAGGGAVGVQAGASGEVRQLAAEVQKLGKEIKNLQPGRLTQVITAAGNVGALLSGVSRYRQAVAQLQKAKEDVGTVISRVSARAREFTSAVGERASGAVATLTSRLPGLAGGLGGAGAGMAAVGGAGIAAATGVGLVVAGVLAFVGALAALSAAIPVIINLLKSLFDSGVDYNSQLEQTRLGIAAVIASLSEVRDASGVRLEGADALAASFELAGDQLAKLKVDAINTTATFGQIAPAFQAAIGPGVRAGLSLDQIRETTVKIVQAAGALGIPMHQVNQEVRAILEGTINEDARLAKVLGISNEMVNSWRQQGRLAEELNSRLDKFGVAGERAANSLEGLKSNLQEAFEVFSGDATDQAFETLKRRMQQLLPQLFDFKNARLDASFQPLADVLDDIFSRAINIAGDVIGQVVSGVKRISTFIGENRTQIQAILQTTEQILRIVIHYAGQLVGAAGHTSTWHSALELTRGTLEGIRLILLAFAPIINNAAAAANVLLGVLLAASPGLQLLARLSGKPAGAQNEIGFDTVKLNPDGSLMRPTLAPLPRVGGGGGRKGGGGGGGGQDRTRQLTQALAQAELDARAASIEEHFNLFKGELDRERDLLRQRLDDRLVSVRDYYARQRHVAAVAGDNEIAQLEEQIGLAQERRDLAIQNIDPQLKGRDRELAVAAELVKFQGEFAKLEGQITAKQRERAAALEDLLRDERLAADELRRQGEEIDRQLDALSNSPSLRADAALSEIKERFRVYREELVAQGAAAADELRKLDELIQQLGDRAQFDEVFKSYRQAIERLRLGEGRIDLDQELEGFSDEEAIRRKVELQRQYRREVADTLAGLRVIAERTKDPELLAAVERLAIEWKLLGVRVDEVGRSINEDIKRGLKDTLAGIIRDAGSAGERLIALVNQILDRIAALVADRLVERVFGPGGILDGVLGGKGQNGSAGGIGGILSSILGFPQSGPGGNQGGGGGGGGARGSTPPFNPNPFAAIIRNFQQSTVGGLRLVGANTGGTLHETRLGFGQVTGLFGQSISLLGTIANAARAQAGSTAAAAVVGIFKTLGVLGGGGGGGEPAAVGGEFKAVPGGRLVQLAEAGFDELVVTTDPKHKQRTAGLLASFMRRTGILPDFSLSDRILSSVFEGIPQMEAGGFASDLGPVAFAGAGDTFHFNMPITVYAPTPEAAKHAAAAVRREAARGVQQGINRAQSQRKGG